LKSGATSRSTPWCAVTRPIGSRPASKSAVGYRGLCDALAIAYEESGKTSLHHHLINETELINQVITAKFAGRNRDQRSRGGAIISAAAPSPP